MITCWGIREGSATISNLIDSYENQSGITREINVANSGIRNSNFCYFFSKVLVQISSCDILSPNLGIGISKELNQESDLDSA